MLIALDLAQIPALLLLMLLTDRLVRRPAAYAVGILRVIVSPDPVAIVAAAFAGFTNAAMLTLPSLLGEADEVLRLSAAMFSIGYGFAVIMTILSGRLWDASGMVVLSIEAFVVTAALPAILSGTLMKLRS